MHSGCACAPLMSRSKRTWSKRGMNSSDSEIVSSNISCEESFETEHSAGSSCDNEIFLSVIWVSPSIQNNKPNQWNLVLRAAVMTNWSLVGWKIYTGAHVNVNVQSCQDLISRSFSREWSWITVTWTTPFQRIRISDVTNAEFLKT